MSEVIQIRHRYVNSFIIKDEKLVLVDVGTPGSESAIMQKVKYLGYRPVDVSLIIITHGHYDHFGRVDILRRITHAPVAIGLEDADSIRRGQSDPLGPSNLKGRLLAKLATSAVPGFMPFEPDILVDSAMTLHPFGVKGKVFPTPGHTRGSISVCLDDRKVIAGDLVMSFFTRTRPERSLYAEDMKVLRESLEGLLQREPRIIYAGHGGPFRMSSIMEHIRDLREVLNRS